MFQKQAYSYIIFLLAMLTHNSLCSRCKRVNLSCGQIRAFVDGHNFRRLTVAQGAVLGQPAASDMMYMVWDEELAEKASEWAENGDFSHNPNKSIASNRWDTVGENIYYSNFWGTGLLAHVDIIPNIEEALNSWFNEHLNYGFVPFEVGTEKPIGHYTQMIWANSNRVGCGIAQRKQESENSGEKKVETYTLFVCNYGPTGNYIGKLPYTPSTLPRNLQCIQGQCNNPYGKVCSF